jgi:hypothetical protein
MKKLIALFVFAATNLLAASAFAVAPIVLPQTFHIGDHWIWDYFDDQGQLYSTERYTVVETNGTKVLFEMSTRFSQTQEFKAHHRFEADVAQCVNANKNWRLKMWAWQNGRWEPFANSKTLMFEEKFNCVLTEIETRQTAAGPQFRTKPNGTWFDSYGVAAEKSFDGYKFRRRL